MDGVELWSVGAMPRHDRVDIDDGNPTVFGNLLDARLFIAASTLRSPLAS